MNLITAIAVIGLSLPALGQLPDAPKPQGNFFDTLPVAHVHKQPLTDRTEWGLLGTAAVTRGLDTYSTQWMLKHGQREDILPRPLAANTGAMAAYSVGIVGFDYLLAREFERHHHRQWAHVVTLVDIGVDAPFAIHNLFIGHSWPAPVEHSCTANTGICYAPQ